MSQDQQQQKINEEFPVSEHLKEQQEMATVSPSAGNQPAIEVAPSVENGHEKTVEEAPRDMSAVHMFEDATGRNEKNRVPDVKQYQPREKSWAKKLIKGLEKLLGVPSDLEEFAQDYNTVVDPNNGEGEEAGVAYASMKANIADITKNVSTAFVKNNMDNLTISIAKKNQNLAAITQLGKMQDDERVPSTLSRIIGKNNQRSGALIQKTAIESYNTFFFAEEQLPAQTSEYVSTMANVLSNSKTNEIRAMALDGLSDCFTKITTDQKQTKKIANSLVSVLDIRSEKLDKKASYLALDLLSSNRLSEEDQQKFQHKIIKKVKNDVSEEQTLLLLAKNDQFTKPALTKVITKVETETPGMLNRAFDLGLETVSTFFEKNKEMMDKKDLSLVEIYQEAIPERLEKNSAWCEALDARAKKLKNTDLSL